MRYQQPWGISDPNAGYINGDPSLGRKGSIPPAAAFEQPQREIIGVIEKSGYVPVDADLLQLAKGVRSQRMNYARDTGQPNALVVAYDPPLTQADYREGLTLHVRVRYLNTGGCSINAGGGQNVRIRKMNGADVGAGELTNGCVVTLIHDGSAFQLANFGGAGGDTNITATNVPYVVDTSVQAGIIEANFSPALTQGLLPGDIIAVQVAFTNPGPTSLYINDVPPYSTTPYLLQPNGGDLMLQGDVVAGDVVQFFFDGVALRFTPNPEIKAAVTYTIGPAGQQFPDVNTAMNALKRKIVGANGRVMLLLAGASPPIEFAGPIDVAHPSGDRITISGTMIGAPPDATNFQAINSTPEQIQIDRLANLDMLKTRFGTIINVQNRGNNGAAGVDFGVRNSGSGRITFANLLIVGTQPALGANNEFWQIGVLVPPGLGALCYNVSVSGCHAGFQALGALVQTNCFATGNTFTGWSVTGSVSSNLGGAFGNNVYGYVANFGSISVADDQALANGTFGFASDSSSGIIAYWATAFRNGHAISFGCDLYANNASSIVMAYEPGGAPQYLTSNFPAPGTGGLASTISFAIIPRPPPATLP